MSALLRVESDQEEEIAGFSIESLIGIGPFGATYQVLDPEKNHSYALKTINYNADMPLDWQDRFEAQNNLLLKLNDCHIDSVIDSAPMSGGTYYLKDFVSFDGEKSCSLAKLLRSSKNGLSAVVVARILLQIVQALDYAANYRDRFHQGLIHGNIKPENVLIASLEGDKVDIKLADFQPYGLLSPILRVGKGLQRLSRVELFAKEAKSTLEKEIFRKAYLDLPFLAPEVLLAEEATLQSDIYSLGILTYQMLTKSLPRGSLSNFLEKVCLEARDQKFFLSFFERALEPEPKDRFENYSEMKESFLKHFGSDIDSQKGLNLSLKKTERRESNLTPQGMIFIPPGKCLIGNALCGEDALPQHECEFKAFYMDITPVTNQQFLQFVEETSYLSDAEREEGSVVWRDGQWRVQDSVSWKNPFALAIPDDFWMQPVTQITFADAEAYASWLGKRLPSEEEWEYAARGRKKDCLYPWGNEISPLDANYNSESTSVVMSYKPNDSGLYDICGNVWEWPSSWYQAYAGNQQESTHFGEKYRVVRGGAWLYDGKHCMLSYRNANYPSHAFPTVGFRCVKDL